MKKVIKKVKESIKKSIAKIVDFTEPKEKCPTCLGSGLWRPDFTNSPQCEECKGHGVI